MRAGKCIACEHRRISGFCVHWGTMNNLTKAEEKKKERKKKRKKKHLHEGMYF